MNIRIERDATRLTVRDISMLLGSFAILRDGLEITSQGNREGFVNRFAEMLSPLELRNFEASLNRAGETLMVHGDWPTLPASVHGMITQALLQVSPAENELELILVREGSLEITIKDLVNWLRGDIEKLFGVSVSLMPRGERKQFKEAVCNIVKTSNQLEPARYLGAGVIMVGAENLSRTYASMRAKSVQVNGDESKLPL